MKSIIFTFLAFHLSCATHLPGRKGVESHDFMEGAERFKKIEVSLKEAMNLSSDYYTGYYLSLKNNTKSWIRIKNIKVDFIPQKNDVKFLMGSDLSTYMKSIARRNQIDKFNRDTLLSFLTITSSVLALNNQNRVNSVASYAALGSLSYQAFEEFSKGKEKAEIDKIIPEGHLLSPVSVPPTLSNYVWFIIDGGADNTNKSIARVTLKEENDIETVFLIPLEKLEQEIKSYYQRNKDSTYFDDYRENYLKKMIEENKKL